MDQLVADEAVLLLVGEGDARLQLVFDDRTADRRAGSPGIVGTGVAADDLAFELVGRLACDDADRAAKGILAVKGTLRPAEHLDPLDVGQRVVEIAGVGLVDAVDEDTDARLDRIDQGRADAANGNEGAAGAVAVDVEAGGKLGDVLDGRIAALLDQIAADRGRRDRDVLQRLLTLTSGDDDRLVALGARGVFFSRSRRCWGCGGLVGDRGGGILRKGRGAAKRDDAGREQHVNGAVHLASPYIRIASRGFCPSC